MSSTWPLAAGRGGIDELPDGVRDPPPDRHAVVVAGRCELVGARGAFLERQLRCRNCGTRGKASLDVEFRPRD
jgi:hypothetical protein